MVCNLDLVDTIAPNLKFHQVRK